MQEENREIFDNISKRMDSAIDNLYHSLNSLRTGRASISLLDPIKVEAYGDLLQINQVSTITSPESRILIVQVWDKSIVKSVEKAIASSGLGLNPITDGQIIKLQLPNLSEERRKEFVKKAKEYCEQCKIAIRNIRRDGIDDFKNKEKKKEISEDMTKLCLEKVQKLTDQHITKVDAVLSEKSAEIMEI